MPFVREGPTAIEGVEGGLRLARRVRISCAGRRVENVDTEERG